MIKKASYFFLTILIAGFLLWQFKVNIIIWALPTVVNFINPVQDNIPTNWPEGPLERLDQKPIILCKFITKRYAWFFWC